MAKVGRPTEYNEETLAKAQAYLDSCIQSEEYTQDQDDSDDEYLEDQPNGGALKRRYSAPTVVKLPTKGGLAFHLGVSRDTLYEWAKVHTEFSYIMEQLGSVQESYLINYGLSGRYNPTIAKVLLTKHGYTDKIDTDITSGGKPIEQITGMRISKDGDNIQDEK